MVFASFIILTGCDSSEELQPIKEETIDFDWDKAKEMVIEREIPLVKLYSQEQVTKEEFEKLKTTLSNQFGEHDQSILSIFFIQNEEGLTREIAPNSFYPTLLHKGVEIMDASIYNTYYENEFFDTSYLRIKEAYIGPDERLDDWERTYIFKKEDEEWEMHSFSGTMNFTGDEYDPATFDLKEGLD